jgi:hypothetical protein
MTLFRYIPLSVHAGLETLAGPLVMVAPFVLEFGQAATVISVVIGALLLGLALQIPGPQRSVSLSAHASFDYALATFAMVGGLAVGIVTGSWEPAVFLVGIGAALVALTASTRFSAPRGA